MRKAFNDNNWIIRRCRNVRRSTSITWTCITQMDGSRRSARPYFSKSEGDGDPGWAEAIALGYALVAPRTPSA